MDEVICDGCRVVEPHEHKCHGRYAVELGEPTGQWCECEECREADRRLDPEQFAAFQNAVRPMRRRREQVEEALRFLGSEEF